MIDKLVKKRRKLRLRRPAVVSAMILIGGGVTFGIAIVGLASAWGGVVAQTYFDLAFSTPGFDYEVNASGETGNATYDAFGQMRLVGFALMAVVFIYAGLARVMEASEMGIVQQGTSSRMISKSVIFIIILLIFPPIWDQMADTIEAASYWILNPNYNVGYDGNNGKCVDEMYEDPDVWIDEYTNSDYLFDKRTNIAFSGGTLVTTGAALHNKPTLNETKTELERYCDPRMKVDYVFSQMLKETKTGTISQLNLNNSGNYLGPLQTNIQQGNPGILENLFLGLTKALVAIQVMIMTLLIGIMADMLVAMVIAGLPVFLFLSLVPKAEDIANKFLEAIPALMLLPLMSAIIVVVGAGSLAEAPARSGGDLIYTWITALGVVFFAITLPILMVPLLKASTQQAQQVVSSAVQSSSMVTGMAASGMAGGVAGARSAFGNRAFGQMARAGMGGLLQGLGKGHAGVSMGGMVPGISNPAGMVSQMGNLGSQTKAGAASAHAPGSQQDAAADKAMDSLKHQGPSEPGAAALQKEGITANTYDERAVNPNTGNPNDQRQMVEDIDRDVQDRLNRGPPLSKDESKAVNNWMNEPARILNKDADSVTKEDFSTLKEALQKDTPKTSISDSRLTDRAIHHYVQEQGVDPRKFRKQVT